jgi:acyl dehydratase
MALYFEDFDPSRPVTMHGRSVAAPVKVGATVHAIVTAVDRKPTRKPGRGVVTLRLGVFDQCGEQVQAGHLKLLTKRRPERI